MMQKQKQLEILYYEQKFSLSKIAKQFGVSVPTISNWMDKYNIPRRSISEALLGRKLSESHAAKVKKNTDKANLERQLNGVSEIEKARLKQIKPDRTGIEHSMATKAKMRKAHLGKKMSDETRKKMSEARKGIIKGSNHPMYGVKRLDMKAEKNPNWNGGITPLYKKIRDLFTYKEWRRAIFSRDDFKCTLCNTANQLEADHVKQFSIIMYENNIKSISEAEDCEELWDIDNGRTLCQSCHSKTKTYGRRGRVLLNQKKTDDHKEIKHGYI